MASVIAATPQPIRMARSGMRADLSQPINRGCVSFVPLWYSGPTYANDLMGLNNKLTGLPGPEIRNSPTFEPSPLGTVFTSAIGYLRIRSNSLYSLNHGPVTFACWIKPNATSGDVIQSFWGGSNATRNLRLISNLGALDFQRFDDAGVSYASSVASSIDTAQWQLVAGTFDGTNLIAYHNNKAGAPTAVSGSKSSTYDYGIGGQRVYNTVQQTFNGQMALARVWGRVLSPSEIHLLYTQPWIGLEPLSPFTFYYSADAVASAARAFRRNRVRRITY